mmetsp:Transcript_611/g.829  ORF Transcript_611/g.829 Transcript_611/m.829 type:complete len:928 (-) Transcript_611:143-2926(-)|eukprot:CAMPEP_0116013896 /NCGR_PEP_ID=MMETSP0321-20121206/5980_1 /TAXON_ID=163516 /ORGANISM="Leptocylindrus danicus var. danicus, Strain B650" /LENGTH=927 /DNA_ID=CAMNT_0003483495 /DNA_START=160 /DNA_END=2943 /DNA_ORIENTATION=+
METPAAPVTATPEAEQAPTCTLIPTTTTQSQSPQPPPLSFSTFAPSIANPYLCHVCSDGAAHCNAHQSESINLGQTRDPAFIVNNDGSVYDNNIDYNNDVNIHTDPELTTTSVSSTFGRSSFHVTGICCSSEVPVIRKIVKPLAGVKKVAINVTARTVYVDHDVTVNTAQNIADVLNYERFGATVLKDAADSIMKNGDARSEHNNNQPEKNILKIEKRQSLWDMWLDYTFGGGTDKSNTKHGKWNLHPFVIACGFFWLFSMCSFLDMDDLGDLEYLGLVSVFFGLPPIAVRAYLAIRRKQLDAHCNMFFAVIGAILLGEYTEAAAVTFLFSISEWLENFATSRARLALTDIVNLRPERAVIVDKRTNETFNVPASSVGVGDLMSVKSGEKVPCDGVIVEGSSLLDESSLTGEARPVKKCTNDSVSGGTINVGASPLLIRSISTVENSAIARLIQLVEEAQTNQSQTEKIVDAFAKRFTPIVIGAAVFMCTIPWLISAEEGHKWAYNGVVTIVIACPCALVISTPVTYVAGLAYTAKRGVIVKGGSHLEALGRVKHILFDKTGTLTQGKFALLHFGVVGSTHSYTEIMELLAAIQAPSSHPLASALVSAAKSEGISSTGINAVKVQDHTLIKGEGITAKVNHQTMHVGNAKMFRRLDLLHHLPTAARRTAEDWANLGGTVGYVGIDGVGIIGIYCVADNVRPESAYVVSNLQHMGCEVYLLTGDESGAARAVARQVGIPEDNVKASLLPEDKLQFVEDLKEIDNEDLFGINQNHSLVMMCGDGVNDAPALAAANVGVSMGSGAAVAMETSSITLMDSNLKKLLLSVVMGKRVNRTITENIVFSVSCKVAIILLTFMGYASLWGAIVSDVGTMLVVTINGMKLLPKDEHEKEDLASMSYSNGNVDVDALTSDGDMFVDLPISKVGPELT